MSRTSILLASALGVSLLLPTTFVHAFDCPAGTRPAVAGDAAVANGQIAIGTCYDPNDVGIGQAAEQAKQYLLSLAKDLRDSKAPPNNKEHIEPLNNSFAICAANFLKAYQSKYGPVNIVSAFRCGPRSPANLNCNRNENAAAGGASNSNHQIGVAMDISPAGGNASLDSLHSFAQQNPGFGVTFPWPFYNGSVDKPHMQATNTSKPSCNGVAGTTVAQSMGGLPFDNSLRQTLGVPQSTAVPAQTGVPTAPAMPSPPAPSLPAAPSSAGSATPPPLSSVNTTPFTAGTCTPQTYCSSQDGNIYYRTTSCVDQPYQKCPNGCSGLTCNASSTASTQLGDAFTNTNQNTNTNTSTNPATSSFDLINYIANQPTAVEIGTSTPIDITNAVQDTGNATVLHPDYATQTQGAYIQTPPQGSLYGPTPSQTFTSGDLANSPSNGSFGDRSLSIWGQIKATLSNIITYLRPFGSLTHRATAE